MKNTLRIAALVTILNSNTVFAATGTESAGISLMGWLFIGFMAVIVAFQFAPAVIMFGSMMMAIFGKAKNQAGVAGNGKPNS